MSGNIKILVAGHKGMAGSAIVRALLAMCHAPADITTRRHTGLDLTDQAVIKADPRYFRPMETVTRSAFAWNKS
jgi:GDP-L-fucose synthase